MAATPAQNAKRQIEISVAKSPPGGAGKCERASWTAELVELLIETRWSEIGKAKFTEVKNNVQKSQFWSWLTQRFSTRRKTAFDAKQIKNRIELLKTEYKQIIGACKATDNNENVNYPPYWDALYSQLKVMILFASGADFA